VTVTADMSVNDQSTRCVDWQLQLKCQ